MTSALNCIAADREEDGVSEAAVERLLRGDGRGRRRCNRKWRGEPRVRHRAHAGEPRQFLRGVLAAEFGAVERTRDGDRGHVAQNTCDALGEAHCSFVMLNVKRMIYLKVSRCPPRIAAVVPASGHTKYNVFLNGKDLSYHNEAQELSNLVNHAEKETIENPYPLIYLSRRRYE